MGRNSCGLVVAILCIFTTQVIFSEPVKNETHSGSSSRFLNSSSRNQSPPRLGQPPPPPPSPERSREERRPVGTPPSGVPNDLPPPENFPPPTNPRNPGAGGVIPDPVPNDLPPGENFAAVPSSMTFDLRKGERTKEKAKTQTELEKLKALVFAINALNTNNSELLTVNDVLKDSFRGGKIPKEGEAKVTIDLSKYLSNRQISDLRRFVQADPLSCAGEKEFENGVRIDSFVRTIMAPSNYNALMVPSQRRDFERNEGVKAEFDGNPENRDISKDTLRMIIPAGSSGILHPESNRKIVLQKTKDGRIVARSEDVEQENGAKITHDFARRPVNGRGDGHEEIWQLKNGLMAYALRQRDGTVITSAPPTFVTTRIVNPTSCMGCHDSGFIATTGESRSVHGDSLKLAKIAEREPGVDAGLGKKMYTQNPKEYSDFIEDANAKLARTVRKMGGFSPKEFRDYVAKVGMRDVSIAELAKDFDKSEEDVMDTIAGDKRNLSDHLEIDSMKESFKKYQTSKKEEDIPLIAYPVLEKQIEVGRDSNLSIYCALKQRLIGLETAKKNRRRGLKSDDDALVQGNEPRLNRGSERDVHF